MKKIFKKIVIAIITFQARFVLRKYKPQIIAVTGSVGKTSTKDAIYHVLAEDFFVRKSEKSFNSEIGVPLTILGCPTAWSSMWGWIKNILEGCALMFLKNHYPRFLVLEIGVDRPGDMKNITSWLKPNIVVVTQFPNIPVHVEFFKSPEDVIEEKTQLIKAMKDHGALIINNDDEKVRKAAKYFGGKVITYGFGEGSAVRASDAQYTYEKDMLSGIGFRTTYGNSSLPVRIEGTAGAQVAYTALAAIAVGIHMKMNLVRITERLRGLKMPAGRARILEGIKKTTIIDDTYNSSPFATEAILKSLADMQIQGKKIALLGEMRELGEYSKQEHKRIGQIAGGICDMVFVVGEHAQDVIDGALLGGVSEKDVREFASAEEAGKFLESVLTEGDIVLIKGSQYVRMERAVEEIMQHPEQKYDLLVRQEGEWEHR